MKKFLVTAVLACVAYAAPAHASAIMLYQEAGANVLGTLSGSLNLTGMTDSGTFGLAQVVVLPQLGRLSTGQAGANLRGFLNQITGPSAFGPGAFTLANSSSGDAVILDGTGADFWVPANYVSGNPLNATQTFTNRTFANMGLTPGDYLYTLTSGDTLTVRVAPTRVPEPATLALIGVALVGVAARRRTRGAITRR